MNSKSIIKFHPDKRFLHQPSSNFCSYMQKVLFSIIIKTEKFLWHFSCFVCLFFCLFSFFFKLKCKENKNSRSIQKEEGQRKVKTKQKKKMWKKRKTNQKNQNKNNINNIDNNHYNNLKKKQNTTFHWIKVIKVVPFLFSA